MHRYGIHLDHPWSECAREGAPLRLYVRSPSGFALIGEKSQVYRHGRYTDEWSFITRRPPVPLERRVP